MKKTFALIILGVALSVTIMAQDKEPPPAPKPPKKTMSIPEATKGEPQRASMPVPPAPPALTTAPVPPTAPVPEAPSAPIKIRQNNVPPPPPPPTAPDQIRDVDVPPPPPPTVPDHKRDVDIPPPAPAIPAKAGGATTLKKGDATTPKKVKTKIDSVKQ